MNVILGARIERLSDDDGADETAEQRAADKGKTGTGAKQPLGQGPRPEFFGRQRLGTFQPALQIGDVELFDVDTHLQGRRHDVAA